MKILLVYTNRNRFMAPPPIGLATLCPPLVARGHEVEILDLMFARDPAAVLERALVRFRPRLTGFSIRNVDEQDMTRPGTTLADIRPLVQLAARRGQHTVLGGPAFSTFPKAMLDFMGAGTGIAGQAEDSLPRLVETLESALDASIPGLVWRDGERIRCNPPVLPGYAGVRPDWSRIDHRPYRRSMFQAAVVIRSGCAYRCSYCDVPHVFGERFSRRDTASILDDLHRLRTDHGIRVVFLNDPAFNAPLDEAKTLLEEIIRARPRVWLSSTFVHVTGHYDPEFWALYRRAGGLFSVFGVEALSARMLVSYAKPFTLDDVFRSTEQATQAGVRVICTTMFGGPGETNATIDQAVDTISRLSYAILPHGFGIRIMPGTQLFEVARHEGLVQGADELLLPKFYLSREFDLARARKRIGQVKRRHAYRGIRMLPAGIRLMLAKLFGVAGG